MISETHLTNNSAFKIFGYNILRADHPDGTAHGGAALIISNKITHTPSQPSTSPDLQIINTSLLIDSVPVSIASAYFPPGRKFPDNEILQYLSTVNHTFLLLYNERIQCQSPLLGLFYNQHQRPFFPEPYQNQTRHSTCTTRINLLAFSPGPQP